MSILYVIGTPIGNLKDITLRALKILQAVDVIACEDTRRSLKLLNTFKIKKPLISCYAHNEKKTASKIIKILSEDKNIAYMSDAGTPGISDPGAFLVSTVRALGFKVVPVPGVSALSTLMSVSGFPEKSVLFEGFLSLKTGKRRNRLKELLDRKEGFVIYESPYRILKLLKEMAELSPDRPIIVGREMTKVHEEYISGSASLVLEKLENRTKLAGEFSVLVSGNKGLISKV
ncbi:MAG: 16S rRNA (cytidine(1402)-2'-O)-methyltransferase [Spirochaetota bacterium]